MSLEIRPAALYTPQPLQYILKTDTIEMAANVVGMSILLSATTESGDRERSSRLQPNRAHFCMGGRGGIMLPRV